MRTAPHRVNDPNLRPERSWTGELSAEQDVGTGGRGRVTFFAEDTRDSLYSQTMFDQIANRNVSRVQNVGRIRTRGLDISLNGIDSLVRGLELSGSITYADSIIQANGGLVSTQGDTIGKRQLTQQSEI